MSYLKLFYLQSGILLNLFHTNSPQTKKLCFSVFWSATSHHNLCACSIVTFFSSCLDDPNIELVPTDFLKIFFDKNKQELTAVKTKKSKLEFQGKILWNLEKDIRQSCFVNKTDLILEKFDMHDCTFNVLVIFFFLYRFCQKPLIWFKVSKFKHRFNYPLPQHCSAKIMNQN